jgi:peptide/nickel transport system substrate-binding protein
VPPEGERRGREGGLQEVRRQRTGRRAPDARDDDAAVDRATNQARSILNPGRRVAQYHAALALLQRDVPRIYRYNQINRLGVSKRAGGAQIFGDGLIRAGFAGFEK